MISGKYTVFRTHPDLTGAIELIEDMMAFDEEFKNVVTRLTATNPGTFTEIENPLVRAYVEGKLSWCLRALTPYKPAIQLIAEKLYEREELSGDEVHTLFNSFIQSGWGENEKIKISKVLKAHPEATKDCDPQFPSPEFLK